jgi:acyl-CoA synthetase (AMP-forming)/AMP-acid ligase II
MHSCSNGWLNAVPQFPNFVDLLRYRAQTQPEQCAYTFLRQRETEPATLTYRELDRQARAIAIHLQFLGSVGEQALLLYPPGLEFMTAFLGCLYAGAVAVPVYPPRRNQNLSCLQAIATDAQATVVLTTTLFLSIIERWIAQNPELAAMHWLTTDNLSYPQGVEWQKPEIRSDSLAFLQYISESPSSPTGVMISHGNLIHNSAAIQHCFAQTPHSRRVSWLPQYHDMGLIGGILQPLYADVPTVLISAVDFFPKPIRWFQGSSQYQASTSGAEPVRVETIDQLVKIFEPRGFRQEAFYPCYDLAEPTLIVSEGLRTVGAIPVDVWKSLKPLRDFQFLIIFCEEGVGDDYFISN